MRKNIGGTASTALALLNAENIYNGGLIKNVFNYGLLRKSIGF